MEEMDDDVEEMEGSKKRSLVGDHLALLEFGTGTRFLLLDQLFK